MLQVLKTFKYILLYISSSIFETNSMQNVTKKNLNKLSKLQIVANSMQTNQRNLQKL